MARALVTGATSRSAFISLKRSTNEVAPYV